MNQISTRMLFTAWLLWGCASLEAATLRVHEGTLVVNGQVAATNLWLEGGTELHGTGTVHSSATLQGAVSPGFGETNSGALAIGGDAFFDGGVFHCYATDSATLDRLEVAGRVSGTGTLMMTHSLTAFPTQQVVVVGAADSDYSLFALDPSSTNWTKGTVGALNLWVTYGESSRVVLYDLYLRMEGGVAQVCWQTASEEDTVGFDLFRWDGAAWVKVNESLVMAQDPMGATYCVADTGANGTEAFLYKLVEIETDGSVREYGPFERAVWTPRLENVGVDERGVVLRWLSREGETYEVRRTRNLMMPLERLESGVVATPPVNEFVDEEKAKGAAFYQIRVEE